ncbi:hypothetical protein V7075_29240 [Neobacillus drentensis]|uniref:hypothetical protein n=1 Tax=Neobacillus drentensis TaxID=220684 RepID=UPI00300068B7
MNFITTQKKYLNLWETLKQHQIAPVGTMDLKRQSKSLTISLTRKKELRDDDAEVKAKSYLNSKETHRPIITHL